MMGNSPDWRQQMKAARRQARLQARLYRQQVRQQARAYRWQQRLYAGPLAALGTVVMLITFAGAAYALFSGRWGLLFPLFFAGLAVSYLFQSLARGRLIAGLNGFVWLLAIALLMVNGSWSWLLLALVFCIIISSLGSSLTGLFGTPGPTPASPPCANAPVTAPEAPASRVDEPPYTPYHQGYPAQTQATTGASPDISTPAPEEKAASARRYTQPLVSYPEESPPSPEVLPPQSH
ncbi:MAG: hypothetical protein IRZ31_07325 [Thermogemmatispora sp.]|uniref:hypothetical protein n=1 Tax=Thermogemmatispora sp. TaxID=1968838 RepID=UPI00260B0B78|nr:hypothetical protein [Thermogemmatispora sp.]MBX5456697.1 hypothetical protein [Thermogemmatispora sp.]